MGQGQIGIPNKGRWAHDNVKLLHYIFRVLFLVQSTKNVSTFGFKPPPLGPPITLQRMLETGLSTDISTVLDVTLLISGFNSVAFTTSEQGWRIG